MIALDTNVLLYAHRADSPFHDAAAAAVRGLAEGTVPWALPWPCLHEFHSVATHPRVYRPPSTTEQALTQIDPWLQSPTAVLLAEGSGYWPVLREALEQGKVAGPMVHDGRVAALCRMHGVRELWSADRDFSRFPGVRVRNPLKG